MKTQELLELLACPRCQGKLTALPDASRPEGFACEACGCVYPIRDEIPVMLIDESIDRASFDSGIREKKVR